MIQTASAFRTLWQYQMPLPSWGSSSTQRTCFFSREVSRAPSFLLEQCHIVVVQLEAVLARREIEDGPCQLFLKAGEGDADRLAVEVEGFHCHVLSLLDTIIVA